MNNVEPDPEAAFTPEEWERIKELVADHESEMPSDLTGWLHTKACSERVSREVERLIRSAATLGDFLQEPAAQQYLGLNRNFPKAIGKYRILEQLGAGGIGVVYAASDDSLKRRVAVKVLHDQAAANPELRKRLLWDAQAASALNHPNIVVIYEVGADGGADYMAMECIEGKTLAALIPAKGLPWSKALTYAIQIASALEAAHAAGVVHRDLKPGNIMVTDTGTVKLLDFGLAKFDRSITGNTAAPLTIEGKFAGTVAYVSPEQAEGKPVDGRSDIFSFGLVLYEMLTGQRAFSGDSSISILADILHTDPLPPCDVRPNLDRRFDDIVSRCIKKNRDRRFQNVSEVRVRLQEIEDERTKNEEARSAVQTRVVRKGNRVLLAACGVLALTAAGLGWELWRTNQLLAPGPEVDYFQRTGNLGYSGTPDISHDGKRIVYAADPTGSGISNIWIQTRAQNDAMALSSGPYNKSEPAFTSDGESVVYRSERNSGELILTSSHTPTELVLAAGGHDPSLTVDSVLFWKGDVGGSFQPGSATVFLAKLTDRGSPMRLFPKFSAAAYPTWTPAKDGILFWGREAATDRVDWWVSDLHGTSYHPTGIDHLLKSLNISPPRADRYFRFRWLRDGRLLFSGRQYDSTGIWSLPVKSDGIPTAAPKRLVDGTSLASSPSGFLNDFSESIVYAVQQERSTIWRVPLDQEGKPAGVPAPLITGYENASFPSLSSDATRMVFQVRENTLTAAYLLDLPGGGMQPFRPRGSGANEMQLSRNGRFVFFSNFIAGSAVGYRMALPAGEPEKLCEKCSSPSWVGSDGGRAIFEAQDAGSFLLWNGRTTQPLTFPQGNATRVIAGQISPDGRYFAFYGAPYGSFEKRIYLARFLSETMLENPVPLTEGPTDLQPVWSVDGKTIYYLSSSDGSRCVWGLRLGAFPPMAPLKPFEVAHFPRFDRQIRTQYPSITNIGLSASERFLVFTVTESTGNIWERWISKAARKSK